MKLAHLFNELQYFNILKREILLYTPSLLAFKNIELYDRDLVAFYACLTLLGNSILGW